MGAQKSPPARQLPGVAAWQRILKEIQARTAPGKPRSIQVGASLQEIASQIRQRQTPRFFGLIPEQAALLARFFPEAYRLTLEQADQLKQHRFQIPGAGQVALGTEIDWHSDPRDKVSWPVEHINRLKLRGAKGGDPRIAWELSRFYHLARLGQAYLYTQDESYAQEVVAQIKHWIKANPLGFGVNWADTRTIAIRAVNWLWAYYYIIESKALNAEFLALWLASLREHGEYLIKHLERHKPYTSRLMVSLAGLAYLGILLPEFPEAARWRQTGLQRLWQQLEEQVFPDGVYYDLSTAEQRFVTEITLSVSGLCLVNGIEVPAGAQARMRAMLDVIMACTQPDGLVPMIGQTLPDRLLDLSAYGDPVRRIWDHRHLLALGSVVLERQLSEWAGFIEPGARGWSVAAGDDWQDAFWCFASDAAARLTDVITRVSSRPDGAAEDSWVDVKPGIRVRARALARKPISVADVVGSRGFEAGGLYVLRHGDFHLLLSAHHRPMGERAHADMFSITLSAYGRPFLIDPGSYSAKAGLDLKRTASHNVLEILSEAGSQSRGRDALARAKKTRVTIHHWISQAKYDFFDASCGFLTGVEQGFVHRRQLWFDKNTHVWIVHDQVRQFSAKPLPEAVAEVALWFHFSDIPVEVNKANDAIQTRAVSGPNLIILPLGDFRLMPGLEHGTRSQPNGVDKETPVARYSGKVRLPADLILMFYPHQAEVDFKAVRAAGRTGLLTFKKALTSLPGVEETPKKFDRLVPEQD